MPRLACERAVRRLCGERRRYSGKWRCKVGDTQEEGQKAACVIVIYGVP